MDKSYTANVTDARHLNRPIGVSKIDQAASDTTFFGVAQCGAKIWCSHVV